MPYFSLKCKYNTFSDFSESVPLLSHVQLLYNFFSICGYFERPTLQCLVPRRKKKNKDKFQDAKRSLISSVPWESLHPREEGLAAVRDGGQCQNTGLYLFICSSVIRKVKVLFAQLCQIL